MSVKSRIGEATLRMSPTPGISRMIELMELAASRLMKPNLGAGESSVTIATQVTHASPTTVGGMLRAVATYDGVSGRLHRFTVNVFDESGLIGSAQHTRASVIDRTMMAPAVPRAGKADLPLMV